MKSNYPNVDYFLIISNEIYDLEYYDKIQFVLIKPTFVSTYEDIKTSNIKFGFKFSSSNYWYGTNNNWKYPVPLSNTPFLQASYSISNTVGYQQISFDTNIKK